MGDVVLLSQLVDAISRLTGSCSRPCDFETVRFFKLAFLVSLDDLHDIMVDVEAGEGLEEDDVTAGIAHVRGTMQALRRCVENRLFICALKCVVTDEALQLLEERGYVSAAALRAEAASVLSELRGSS